MNSYGERLRITLWGESHGPQIGITLDGVPAGLPLGPEQFEADLARRRSGSNGTTARHEADLPHIVSGLWQGHTTGAPLTILFENSDVRSADYTLLTHHCRPSHADLTAQVKWQGWNDPRGGGMHSGRLTVGLVAVGVVAKLCLPGVQFDTRLIEIGGCTDPAQFAATIAAAQHDGDSVGGIVECRISGVRPGTGEPVFGSIESKAAALLFSIPAVKGVEFGAGFAGTRLRGSEYNDPIVDAAGHTSSNHDGGINGGLANGNEILVRVAVKPTPSIARTQQTYDFAAQRIAPLTIGGRHDACIALRAAVVIEAAMALALADLTLGATTAQVTHP